MKKLTAEDNIVCCQNLLLNQNVVNNHIFSATNNKLRKYKSCHENARGNGSLSNPVIIPFAVDTQGNFCSVAFIIFEIDCKIEIQKYAG